MFESMRYIQLENSDKAHIDEIKNILTNRNNGHCKVDIYPECEEPLENIPNSIDNSIIFNLYAEDFKSEQIIASKILNDIKKLLGHDNFTWDFCPGPVIRINFKKDCEGVDKNSIEEIFSKKRENGVGEIINSKDLPSLVHSFVFQIKCQQHHFNELYDEFIKEINQLGCKYNICYYRHL